MRRPCYPPIAFQHSRPKGVVVGADPQPGHSPFDDGTGEGASPSLPSKVTSPPTGARWGPLPQTGLQELQRGPRPRLCVTPSGALRSGRGASSGAKKVGEKGGRGERRGSGEPRPGKGGTGLFPTPRRSPRRQPPSPLCLRGAFSPPCPSLCEPGSPFQLRPRPPKCTWARAGAGGAPPWSPLYPRATQTHTPPSGRRPLCAPRTWEVPEAGLGGPYFEGYPSTGPKGRGDGGHGSRPSASCAAAPAIEVSPLGRRLWRGPVRRPSGTTGGPALTRRPGGSGLDPGAPGALPAPLAPRLPRDTRSVVRLAANRRPPPGSHGDAVSQPARARLSPAAGGTGRAAEAQRGDARSRLSMESGVGTAAVPRGLPYYVAFSQLLGLTVVAMTGAWLGLYRGGIAWKSALQFNVHPLCMVIGLIFLQGDALLVYRVFRNEAKRTTKVLHGLLHVFAFIIALVGLVAVFNYHKKKGYADLYSLHSWCGILVFTLYFVQWLVGFSFFLFPGASFSLRSRYRPQHIFFGATIFLLSVGTALLGLKEALLFKLGTKYSTFTPEGVLANILGLLLACFGVVVLYILTRTDWKRPSQAEEQALSMDFKTLTEGDSPSSQ